MSSKHKLISTHIVNVLTVKLTVTSTCQADSTLERRFGSPWLDADINLVRTLYSYNAIDTVAPVLM